MKTIAGGKGGLIHPPEKGDKIPGGGRPKGSKNVKTQLMELLKTVIDKQNPLTGSEKMTAMEVINLALWQQAANGNVKAYQEIIDRIEGKISQSIDLNTNPVPTEIKWVDVKRLDEDVSLSEQEIIDREGL